MRRPLLLLAILALGACRMGLGGGDTPVAPAGSLGTESIEVTTLDAPPAASPAALPATTPPGSAAPSAVAPPAAGSPATAAPAAGSPQPDDPAAAPAAPEVVKSPSQLACEKRRGSYIKVKSLFTCVKTPRDAGQRCSRDSDCSGHCLARSQTCAPFDPLIGCNDILDDEGRRITLCLD